MSHPILSVREIQQSDIVFITNYWLNSPAAYLQGMGVDLAKMPTKEQWIRMLEMQLHQPYLQKQSYCIIWELDGKPIGHSNVNKIVFGESASVHLHIWYATERSAGFGPVFIQLTLPYFFTNLQLKTIYCEPYAQNPSPNKVLKKASFTFIKEYRTAPGNINFEEVVRRWEISSDPS
jgi:RimJ/RimL family protein N-acetyltransferase